MGFGLSDRGGGGRKPSYLGEAEGPGLWGALATMVADFEGLTEGAGDVALDPMLLPQSEGTALRGVLPPELESFKLAQLHLVGLAAIPGDCEGLPTGLAAGLATAAWGSSTFASAITCGGTTADELATVRFTASLSELGLSGIP